MILNKIIRKFQLKIKNREAAGNILAETLKGVIKKDDRKDTLVLGLARGGVMIGKIIASKLSCDFELVISRRLRAPHNEELAIGAVTMDGTTYLNEPIITELGISPDYLKNEISEQLIEIKAMIDIYTNPLLGNSDTHFNNKTIVLVDDGAATGSTILATIRSLRKSTPKRIIVALPVSPKNTISLLKREGSDYVEVIISPNDANFGSIDQYYENFKQVTDEEVLTTIRQGK